MEVVPFTIEHFDALELKPGSPVSRERRPLFEIFAKAGPARTMFDGDLVIGCSGILCGAWKGIGEVWSIPSVHVPKYPKSVYKEAMIFINESIEALDLYRLHTTIREEDTTAIRWIEKLGFQREGLMRQFGPWKENHYMYARII